MFDVYPHALVLLGFLAVIGVGSILAAINDAIEALANRWRR